MGRQYEKIKKETGVEEVLNASDTDSQNDKIYKELRPHSKGNFKEFIRKQTTSALKKQFLKNKLTN